MDVTNAEKKQAKDRAINDLMSALDDLNSDQSHEEDDIGDARVSFRTYLGMPSSKTTVLAYIVKGIPAARVKVLSTVLHVPQADMLDLISISSSTFNRRMQKSPKRLSTDESDRLARFARILALAVSLMEGDEEAATQWLKTPAPALGGDTPLDHARTETGARAVERLIQQIEHGIYI